MGRKRIWNIIAYELSNYEQQHIEHVSGERSYTAKWSLPFRVTKTKRGSVCAIPLWQKGPEKQIPLQKILLLGSYVPLVMKQLITKVIQLKDKTGVRKQIPKEVLEEVEITNNDGLPRIDERCKRSRSERQDESSSIQQI